MQTSTRIECWNIDTYKISFIEQINESLRSDHQREDMYLHETTESYNHVVQARITKKLLGAILDLHEWNLRMLVTVVDRKEDKFLNSHCLCALYESNFSFPVYLKGKSLSKLDITSNHPFYSSPDHTHYVVKITNISLFLWAPPDGL